MEKEIKWKCHNCNITFTSVGEDGYIEDVKQHISDCFDANDYIHRI